MSTLRCRALTFLLLVAPLAAAPRFVDDAALIDRVVELLDRRLALMPEVAATKYSQQKPIADPAREQEVLEHSVADAQALQLDPTAARAFFSVQILMARAIQERCFTDWKTRDLSPPRARDLAQELRPALDAIGRELLPAVFLASSALAAAPPSTLEVRLATLRRHTGVTDDHLAELARALRSFRLTAAPTWNTIERVGTVRIGTTGDYAPFSDDHAGELRGLDIELAQTLGEALGLRVMFVRTSWPTLMEDLRQHRFDLAASGISITDERRRRADFSTPYFFDGKTPIARRDVAARFSSLSQIDQPGVRVIVNPGGTNERFVREHITRATILVHPDNRTIFAELVARRADVMITDGIEVRLQETRHPELRGTMSEPFTRAGKAFLLPPGSELTSRANTWLQTQLQADAIAPRLARALSASDRANDQTLATNPSAAHPAPTSR